MDHPILPKEGTFLRTFPATPLGWPNFKQLSAGRHFRSVLLGIGFGGGGQLKSYGMTAWSFVTLVRPNVAEYRHHLPDGVSTSPQPNL